ncbi:hypothetical protein MKK64_24485 [Methylobacterium sp. E-025]|uniref:hypothetical protein n=1 Tax=Methylobacterium sp. E-025 TaxID=2836561 RepID=UPI001FBB73B9|nr:hypothetical protein [Methylobacterium sp. E-025]MCJ2114326.1 hypothetical protein [Methylobacterium sp. E-025]
MTRLPRADFLSGPHFPLQKAAEMKLSAEFCDFSLQFYQDLLDDVSSEEEMIRTVLSPLKDAEKRARLREYLGSITADEFSDEDFRKLWWSSSADIVFHDGAELRGFLKRVRDRL